MTFISVNIRFLIWIIIYPYEFVFAEINLKTCCTFRQLGISVYKLENVLYNTNIYSYRKEKVMDNLQIIDSFDIERVKALLKTEEAVTSVSGIFKQPDDSKMHGI